MAGSALAQDAANDKINLAIIGVGSQGQALMNTCMKMESVNIQAICDIWENYNLNKTSGILTKFKQDHKAYTDYQEMLATEKGLDAVIIATPDFCHVEQTVACLKAGLNVYCESAMANTIDGAKLMAKTAKETGKFLQIGLQRRSNPWYQYSRDHIINETKLLGKITALNGQWNQSAQPDRRWPKRYPIDDAVLNKYGFQSMQQFRNWKWYKELGGGPLAELGTHQIDVFNWFMGAPPKSIMASGGTEYYDSKTHEQCDTLMVILEYENKGGNIRAFYQSINSCSNFGYLENFMGDEGTLYVSEAASRVGVYREEGAPDWEKWVKIGILKSPVKQVETKKEGDDTVLEVQETGAPPSYDLPVTFNDPVCQPHLENFFKAIRGAEKLNCPPETALASSIVIQKIGESIRESKRIEMKPEDYLIAL